MKVYLVDSPDEIAEACDEKYISGDSSDGWIIGVKKADGTKCNRCWFYDDQVGKHDLDHNGICQRCNDAIATWENEKGEKFVLEPEETPTLA